MPGTVGLHFAQRSSLRSRYITRTDAITLYIILTILGSNITGQHFQSTFGGSISRNRFAPQLTHHRADVDNLSMAFSDHPRYHRLRHDKRSIQVNIDHLTKFSSTHFGHRNPLDDAGVVYQDVDFPDLLPDP